MITQQAKILKDDSFFYSLIPSVYNFSHFINRVSSGLKFYDVLSVIMLSLNFFPAVWSIMINNYDTLSCINIFCTVFFGIFVFNYVLRSSKITGRIYNEYILPVEQKFAGMPKYMQNQYKSLLIFAYRLASKIDHPYKNDQYGPVLKQIEHLFSISYIHQPHDDENMMNNIKERINLEMSIKENM